MNLLKRLYNWILGWSESRWGALALFLLAFAESSFFPIPPDVLLIALCLGCAAKAFRYAAICTVGSLLGAVRVTVPVQPRPSVMVSTLAPLHPQPEEEEPQPPQLLQAIG